MKLFDQSEVDIALACIDIFLLDRTALVHGFGLTPEVKTRFASAVVPKLKTISVLTSFDNQEFMFIDMALNYAYQLYSSSDDEFDLDALASLILKVEHRLDK